MTGSPVRSGPVVNHALAERFGRYCTPGVLELGSVPPAALQVLVAPYSLTTASAAAMFRSRRARSASSSSSWSCRLDMAILHFGVLARAGPGCFPLLSRPGGWVLRENEPGRAVLLRTDPVHRD